MAENHPYRNFVRASSREPEPQKTISIPFLRGEDAQRMYLEEVKDVKISKNYSSDTTPDKQTKKKPYKTRKPLNPVEDKDIFLAAQNNEVDTIKGALQINPDKLNMCDDYGWSLLMIACQANSLETVKELLKQGADTSIRDKAGNSARSLVIQNKNSQIATLLLDHSKLQEVKNNHQRQSKEPYTCESCGNKTFPDKQEHLTSTVHNINSSKGRKITSCYRIPETNKGFQMMLKKGWDKDSGLGASGDGIRYPIKPVEKKDRKGLGLKKKIIEENKINDNKKIKINHRQEYHKNRNLEISFRREFY